MTLPNRTWPWPDRDLTLIRPYRDRTLKRDRDRTSNRDRDHGRTSKRDRDFLGHVLWYGHVLGYGHGHGQITVRYGHFNGRFTVISKNWGSKKKLPLLLNLFYILDLLILILSFFHPVLKIENFSTFKKVLCILNIQNLL